MEKKTKILAIGDIHADTRMAEKLAKQAEKEKVDLVILAGDLTWLDQSWEGIIGPFVKVKKQVLLIPGNNEPNTTVNFLANMYPNTKNIHGYPHKIGNLGIFGAGYDSLVGPFWIEDEEIFRILKQSHEKVKDAKRKIMVTHAIPAGSKSEIFPESGSKAVARAIKEFKPDIAISGHIHEAGGIEEKIGKTRIFNVARKPKIFEI